MKYLFLILLSGFFIKTYAQSEEVLSSEIKPFVYSFKIADSQMLGEGADTLKSKISGSQFFMLGEEHFSPQISALTNVLLPYFSSCGYQNFALETGPFSTITLIEEIRKNHSLYPFNHSFYKQYNEIPIPFFEDKGDEIFLKTAIEEGFSIWGIDQEFISAQLFLIDRIHDCSNDKKNDFPLYKKAKEILQQEFEKYLSDDNYPMFTHLLNSSEIKSYFQKSDSEQQQEIISSILSSWRIYSYNESHEYHKNNQTRMKLMKFQFGENYTKMQKQNNLPKVVIKMGSMHLGRGKSWLGIFDLGNMIYELADFNGTNAISVNCFSRYIENEDGTVDDYIEDEDGKNLSLILNLVSPATDEWMLVDTEKIIQLAKKKKVKLNNDLHFLLSKYDYIILAPSRTKVEHNY